MICVSGIGTAADRLGSHQLCCSAMDPAFGPTKAAPNAGLMPEQQRS